MVFVDARARFHRHEGDLHADAPVSTATFGNPGDVALFGDWDCDGESTPAMYRPSNGFMYLRNSFRSGAADVSYFFGDPADIPIAGDFDGDGCDTLAIYRPSEGKVYIKNSLRSGGADHSYYFGNPGDTPFSGDFDGDGVDTVGLHRQSTGLVYLRNSHDSGAADASFVYGDPGDRLVAGDWDGTGTDSVAVYRPSARSLYIKLTNESGGADHTLEVPGEFEGVLRGTTCGRCDVAAAAAASSGQPSPAPTSPATPPAVTVEFDVALHPGDDFQSAVDANPAGTTYLVKAGTHRMQSVLPRTGDTFVGEPGAVMSGARLLTAFDREGPYWVATGQTQQGQVHGVCATGHAGCSHPEDLFIDDVPLRQVTQLGEVGPGTWFFDYDADKIYFTDDPTGRKVETSVTRHAFDNFDSGRSESRNYPSGVTIRDLVIEKYANPAQHGAIHAGGHANGSKTEGLTSGWLVEGVEVRLNHGAGIRIGDATTVRASFVHHNGQLGIGGKGAGSVVEDTEVAHNNWAGFKWGWEGGGTKFSGSVGLVVRGNYVHHNDGPGLWADIDNIHTVYEGNLVSDNTGPGIFHEISYDAVIRDNVVERNGFGSTQWVMGSGIVVAGSPNVEVVGNVVQDNAGGISGMQQDRGSGRYGLYQLRNFHVHGNEVRAAQGYIGVVQDSGDSDVFSAARANRFEGNTYDVGSVDKPFAWMDAPRTPSEWRAYGHDTDGTFA